MIAAAEAQKNAPAPAPQAKAPSTSRHPRESGGPGRKNWFPLRGNDEAKEERVKMSRLRQTIAKRLKEAQNRRRC